MVVALLSLVLAASGVAVAAIPDSSGVIHGCYSNRTGALRVIDVSAGDSCSAKETVLTWNEEGPQGPAGADGQDGADGTDGDMLVGSPCELPNGTAGTVAMAVDAGGTITFTCDTGGGDPGGGDPLPGYDCTPSGAEVWDGRDNDCDGQTDEGTTSNDADGDGYTAGELDCDDRNPDVPGPELANGIDDDCNGLLGTWNSGIDTGACVMGVFDETTTDPYLSTTVAPIPPSGEIEDGLDNDCDDVVDDGPFGEDATFERCNYRDDDFDDIVDEAWPELGSTGPYGGTWVCSEDGSGTVERI